MELILIFVVVAIIFFIYNGFRTRCPSCANYSLHSKDDAEEKRQAQYYKDLKKSGLGDALDRAGSPLGSARSKPGYANAKFICKSCGHPFSRREAVIWAATANKLGKDIAISEYTKLIRQR